MELANEIVPFLSAGVSVFISGITAAVSHGMMKEKVTRLERDSMEHRLEDRDNHELIRREYVTQQHFEAIIGPFRDSIRDVQKDLKTILSRLPKV